MGKKRNYYFHIFYYKPIKQLNNELISFLRDNNKDYSLSTSESNSNLSITAISHKKLSFFDSVFGNIRESNWALKKLSESETLLCWKPKITVKAVAFHWALQVILLLLFYRLFFEVFSTDGGSIYIKVIFTILFLLSVLDFALIFFLFRSRALDEYREWSKYQTFGTFSRFHVLRFGYTRPFYFNYLAIFLVAQLSVIGVLPLLFFNPILGYSLLVFPLFIFGIMAFDSIGDKDIARLDFASTVLTANLILLIIGLCPLLVAYLINNFVPNLSSLDRAEINISSKLLMYGSTIVVYIGITFSFLGPWNDYSRRVIDSSKRYREFSLTASYLRQLGYMKNNIWLKTFALTLFLWFQGVWLMLAFQTIGNIVFHLTGTKVPYVFIIDSELLHVMSTIASFRPYSINNFTQWLMYIYVFAPSVCILILYCYYLINNFCRRVPIPSQNTLNVESKKKLNLLQDTATRMVSNKIPVPKLIPYESNTINSFIYVPIFLSQAICIYISTGALNKLKYDELKFLLAHEIGHINSRSFRRVAYIYKIISVSIGCSAFMSLFCDIPNEERCADIKAVRGIGSEVGEVGIRNYCEFIMKVQDYNSIQNLDSTLSKIIERTLPFVEIFETDKFIEGIKAKRNLVLMRVLANIKHLYEVVFLNRSILRIHPTAENRVETIYSTFGLRR